jgi:hypothetical protein
MIRSNGDVMETIMQHLATNDVERRLVREVACTKCYQRPPGSESLGPEVPRMCEASCPLFYHLPTLARLARQVGNIPGECEIAVKDLACSGCRLRETFGDYCADYGARTCPLSRHSAEVISALQKLAQFDSGSLPST